MLSLHEVPGDVVGLVEASSTDIPVVITSIGRTGLEHAVEKGNPVADLTVEDLMDVMREAAGEDEAVGLQKDVLDIPFVELGIDSLGLLEAVSLIKRKYGVEVADDELASLETPRDLLNKVNTDLALI